MAIKKRMESDSMGEIAVDASKYWGAQTERSLHHFAIQLNRFKIHKAVIKALAVLKKSAAKASSELGLLDSKVADLIMKAADEVITGKHDDQFPLSVFQTGSGTQSNMNMNEVISNRAIEIAGGVMGSKCPVHPNDHVNMGQSSNDTFPTAMYIATVLHAKENLLPVIEVLKNSLAAKAKEYKALVKVGRTHLQDATPITLGQEFGAMVAQLEFSINNIEEKLAALSQLAIGGTAVGTGLNAHPQFGDLAAKYIAKETQHKGFKSADNKFFALSAHDALLEMSGAMRTLASSLMKIANDVRWLASGPRCGIGEIILPENEPGSSIMPGKVNPTQCEALTMICTQIYGNDATVGFAASQGNFQLNVFKPVMAHNVLESIDLLVDALPLFTKYCVDGIEANLVRIKQNLDQDLMLVTALNKRLGYDVAAQMAKYALRHNISLLKASKDLQLLGEEEYNKIVDPLEMTNLDRSTNL